MARKRQRKRGSQTNTLITYVIVPENWDIVYGFGVNASKWDEGPYSEYETLQIDGKLIEPEGGKQTFGKIMMGGRNWDIDRIEDEVPTSIGYLRGQDETLQGFVSIPISRLNHLINLLIAKRIQALMLVGTPLRYRKGSIHSVELNTLAISAI